MKYYLVIVWEDVDPEVCGPYQSKDDRDIYARDMRKRNGDNHGYYRASVSENGFLQIEAYSSEFFTD